MPASSKRCIFCFFRENCFFIQNAFIFGCEQFPNNCMFVRNVYTFMLLKRFFYPTKRRFLPTKRRFFPTMFYFSVEMPHFPLTKYHGFPCETIIIILQWWDFHMCSNM